MRGNCKQQHGSNHDAKGQNGEEQDGKGQSGRGGDEGQGEQCGLSPEQLLHEDLGDQQSLRSEDEQNMFVAGIIRRGLYKEGWKLVTTGAVCLPGLCAKPRLSGNASLPGMGCPLPVTAHQYKARAKSLALVCIKALLCVSC